MKKVFILGAGASRDFEFPSGMKLMQEIHSSWSYPNDETIANYANIMMGQTEMPSKSFNKHSMYTAEQKIKKLSNRLYFSGADSIDDFLSQCKDDVDVQFGKLTILKVILEKEQRAKEFGDSTLFKWEESWLRVLFGEEFRFVEGVEELKRKLEDMQFYFVIFNYDRCVEHFLYTAIQNYYGLEDEGTKSIIDKMRFYHVYGQLAPLRGRPEDCPVGFGEAFDGMPDDLYHLVPNIKIVNEDRGDAENIRDKIGAQIRDAGKVYILGFGFQDSNWKLLGIDKYKEHRGKGLSWPGDKFHYTNSGLSKRSKERIQNEFFGFMSSGIEAAKPYDVKIYDFMHHDYT